MNNLTEEEKIQIEDFELNFDEEQLANTAGMIWFLEDGEALREYYKDSDLTDDEIEVETCFLHEYYKERLSDECHKLMISLCEERKEELRSATQIESEWIASEIASEINEITHHHDPISVSTYIKSKEFWS